MMEVGKTVMVLYFLMCTKIFAADSSAVGQTALSACATNGGLID